MRPAVLIDTGPLVAILCQSDSQHLRCAGALRSLARPLYTCWPVITEACWLLRAQPKALQALLGGFETGLLELFALNKDDMEPIAKLLQRYETLQPQVADAALVHLANREGIEIIFTLDRRDFTVYRLRGARKVHLIPEEM